MTGPFEHGRNWVITRLLPVSLAVALAACSPAPPAATPTIVAPMPQQYSCDQLSRAAAEFNALPSGAMLATMMDDYRVERRALRALHKLPEQRCPKATP